MALHERRRNQRDRLLSAARTVFAQKGFASASIDDIVALAQVSRTSFYRSFANKEECLLLVLAEAMETLTATFAGAAAADDVGERIRLGVRAMIEGLASDPELARVVLVEVVGATPALEEARINARAGFAALIESEMRRHPGWRSRSDEEIRIVSTATMAAIAECVSELVALGRAEEWPGLVEPLTDYVLRALTPHED